MAGFQMSVVIHAVVYVLVVGGLWALNQDATPDVQWIKWVAWGWGIGLAAHTTVWALLRGKARR
ncbi:MAG: 2TM domain-containing protein [Aquabacterium sp.]|jgi:hypothetical protein